jgi:uncharacterized membrane protein YcjF (UPF0283 family)
VSVLEVEVAVLIVVIVAAIVAVVLTYRGVVRLVGNRERAMDGHIKAVSRHALVTTNKANDVLVEAQAAREDARLTLARVETHIRELRG